MKRLAPFLLFVLALLAGVPAVAIVLQPVLISDVQSNTTNVGYFHKQPLARYWNFRGGAAYNTSTKALDITTDWSGPSPTPTPSPGTAGQCSCTLYRDQHYTQFGADGGVDLTYFCCQKTDGTCGWIAGYCH